jgi:hypothetical protein
MTGLLVVALIVASLIIAWLLVYKARQTHRNTDLLKERQDNQINRRAD